MGECISSAIPQIKTGDLIKVYDIHQQAWGQPAKEYCVRRVDSDGSPVSDCDFRHNIKDVVSVHRKQGKDFVCIYERENYEVEPFAEQAINLMYQSLPDNTRDSIEKDIKNTFKEVGDTCNRLFATKINDQITFGEFLIIYYTIKHVVSICKNHLNNNTKDETNGQINS